jgi:rhamnose transport system substrate-binding protein
MNGSQVTIAAPLTSRRATHARLLVLLVASPLAGCSSSGTGPSGAHTAGKAKPRSEIVIAMLPKLTNIAYFRASREGAKKAADELGVKLIYDGPTDPSARDQNNFMESRFSPGTATLPKAAAT